MRRKSGAKWSGGSFSIIAALIVLASNPARAQDNPLSDQKLAITAQCLIEAAGNKEMGTGDSEFISQKELQRCLRFVHRQGLSVKDVINIKTGIGKLPEYSALAPERQMDLDKVLGDILFTRGRMGDLEQGWGRELPGKFFCRFACLTDDPNDEVSKNSFTGNPEKYRGELPDELIDSRLKNIGKRSVIGLCWREKKYMDSWTRKISITHNLDLTPDGQEAVLVYRDQHYPQPRAPRQEDAPKALSKASRAVESGGDSFDGIRPPAELAPPAR